jgi:hypothetical protein
MIRQSHIRNTILIQETVKDVLIVRLPSFLKEELEVIISGMDGKVLTKQVFTSAKETILNVSTKSLQTGTYIIQMASNGNFIARSFNKV